MGTHSQSNETFAFLGPAGTYTDLALKKYTSPSSSVACLSIAEVFDKVASGAVTAGFVPIENVIQGPITETLDSLLEHHRDIYVADGFIMEIRHALGVLNKKAKEDRALIRRVISHFQPMQQCSSYLQRILPEAERIYVESTAVAAKRVSTEKLMDAAVIGAKETLEQHSLLVLEDDISNIAGNKTRFVVIRRGSGDALPVSQKTPVAGEFITSIVVHPGRDRKGLLFELLKVISVEHGINILSIHSRPDKKGGFVFHLNLEGHRSEPEIAACLAALKRYLVQATGETAEFHILGTYQGRSFHPLPFETIGIVGGKGKMGSFFEKFFHAAGFNVLIADRDSGSSLKELANADVIILSVPMSATKGLVEQLVPYLRVGQLVVENCSIKASSLPHLLALVPAGVEVLGIHTMFGGDVPTMSEENIIITKTTSSAAKAQAFEDLLYKHGARISAADTAEHDATTSYVQTLIQFALLTVAEVMSGAAIDSKKLDIFSTPNSRRVFEAITKVLSQNDDLIRDLQLLNTNALRVRNRFLEVAVELAISLNNGDTAKLDESIRVSRKYFKI